MHNSKEMDVKVKFGLKSFIAVVAILLSVLIVVGVLTFVIPAGRYTIYTTDEAKIGQPFYEYTTDESLDKQIVIVSTMVVKPSLNVINRNCFHLPPYRLNNCASA